MGIFYPYIPHADVRLIGVEAAGEGIATGRHAASLTRRPARRAARQPHLPAAGRERPDHRDAFGLGRARLSGRRSRARVAQGHRPRRVRGDHRRRGARGVPRVLPHRGHHSRRSNRRTRSRTREARADAAARTRSCWSISPAAATRTCTPSPSARASSSIAAPNATRRARTLNRIDATFAQAPRRRAHGADPVRHRGRSVARRRRCRSCTRWSRPAPTSSSSACRFPIRWPTAR